MSVFVIDLEGPEFDALREEAALTGDWSDYDAACDAVVDCIMDELLALYAEENDGLSLDSVIVPND